MKNEQYEYLVKRYIKEIEQLSTEAREKDRDSAALKQKVIDAAQDLALEIMSPLLATNNQLVDEDVGMSLFPYMAFYCAIEYVSQSLDIITGSLDGDFPEETKAMAKRVAFARPICTTSIEPLEGGS